MWWKVCQAGNLQGLAPPAVWSYLLPPGLSSNTLPGLVVNSLKRLVEGGNLKQAEGGKKRMLVKVWET